MSEGGGTFWQCRQTLIWPYILKNMPLDGVNLQKIPNPKYNQIGEIISSFNIFKIILNVR